MLATVRLDFDSNLSLFGADVRLQAVAVAGCILVAMVIAGILAGRMRRARNDERHLRRDDLLLIALGAIPGAVVGGRLGYLLIHLDYYAANPALILDPSVGSLALTLAVVLGTLSALAVARLLDAPLGRWLHVAAVPLLVLLGLGKLAMVLGGAGQGTFGDGSWSTAYVQPGPWESAFADRPAIASQAIEGVLTLVAAALLIVVPFLLRFRIRRWWRIVRPGWSPRRDWRLISGARRFVVALILWGIARFAAAATWRDAKIAGQLRTEQIVVLALVAASVLALVIREVVERRRASQARKLAAETVESSATSAAGTR